MSPKAGYVRVASGWAHGRTGRVLEVIDQEPTLIEGTEDDWEHHLPLVRIRDELGIFIVPINYLGECYLYYLGEQVHPINGLVESDWPPDRVGRTLFEDEQPPKGWVEAEWSDGRTFIFWKDQLKLKPWGPS